MIKLQGKYNKAVVYTDNIEQQAISQIIELCNQEFAKGSKIAIMPDTHAGAGCTIGTTITLHGKVVPNLVGVDIGCGMLTVKLKEKDIDFDKLDNIIRKYIPSGQNIRNSNHNYNKYINLDSLYCAKYINMDRAKKSIGTLGGGNHFIECDKDNNGSIYLVVHTGSRYLGKQIAEHYQKIAIKNHKFNRKEKTQLIEQLKKEDRHSEIEETLKKFNSQNKIPDALCYLQGEDYNNYLYDMCVAQHYAQLNRETIVDTILEKMNLNKEYSFHTVHNYIDTENKILRKGAIAAYEGMKVLIPINMRDGSILAIGKGNPDWNYSAPHGAGRLMSRSEAKATVSLESFQESMKGIYSTSVLQSTIDEAPMAYKPIDEILSNIKDSVEVLEVIKPIYNYKAN